MRRHLGVLSALLLAAAGGLVAVSIIARPQDAYLTPELSKAFDASSVAADPPDPAQAPPPMPPAAGFRDALASNVVVPSPAAARAPSAAPPPPSAVAWIASNKTIQSLTAAPARFMVNQTLLGNADGFGRFLHDGKRVEKYFDQPMVRGLLNDPDLLKGLLSQPSVIQAFLSSPAMQDPRTVRALASSAFFRKIMDSRSVAGMLKDPLFVQRMVMDPRTTAWIAKDPAAAEGLLRLIPALSQSFGRSFR